MTPNRSSSLRDIRFRARIPNTRGDRIGQQKNKSMPFNVTVMGSTWNKHYCQYQAKSKNYIKQYLLQKGIDTQLIEEQISLFYENNKNLEKENALKFAKKRNLLDSDQDYQKKLSKMARAGFSYDIAKEILK